jgi:hypothetical protein
VRDKTGQIRKASWRHFFLCVGVGRRQVINIDTFTGYQKGLLKLGAKRSIFSGLHIVLLVLLGDVGLHGVPRGAEPLAVGAAEPAGAQMLRFHVILLTANMVSTQIKHSKVSKTAKYL